MNVETTKAIIEAYTKTSSATFTPKQSDMHFWYSPDCGIIIVAEATSSVGDKNQMVVSGKDAKGNPLIDTGTNATIWIDLTTGSLPNGGENGMPDDAFYVKPENTFAVSNYMQILTSCNDYADEGGFDVHCIKIFEESGRSLSDFAYWDDILDFMYEHLNDEFTNHLHGNAFAFAHNYTAGMTWQDFINSPANVGQYAVDKDGIVYCSMSGDNYGYLIANNEDYAIRATDTIDADVFYFISFAQANID